MIEINHIHKQFDHLQILSDVNLQIHPGEILSIIGPSGAGKTTLLQIAGTLLRPDSGNVIINGQDIYRLNDNHLAAFRNKHIGFIYQFHQLLPEFTMAENIALPAMIAGQTRRQATSAALDIIQYLGLKDRANHLPAQLSGGERQRAAVARALINQPSIILADEPTGSLDSHNRQELHQLFLNLSRDRGQTFLIVTHDPDLASLTDRTIHMADGKIIHP